MYNIEVNWFQVVWVCILCRKKQELLSKTGQWMMKGGVLDPAMKRLEQDMQFGTMLGELGTPSGLMSGDKRPKLERAHSAAEKENLPMMQRSGSVLRRQYSQQEQSQPRRMSTSDSGVDVVSPGQRGRQRDPSCDRTQNIYHQVRPKMILTSSVCLLKFCCCY